MITGIQNVSFNGSGLKMATKAIESFDASRALMPKVNTNGVQNVAKGIPSPAEISAAYSKAPLGNIVVNNIAESASSRANATSYAASRGIPLDQVGAKLNLNV